MIRQFPDTESAVKARDRFALCFAARLAVAVLHATLLVAGLAGLAWLAGWGCRPGLFSTAYAGGLLIYWVWQINQTMALSWPTVTSYTEDLEEETEDEDEPQYL